MHLVSKCLNFNRFMYVTHLQWVVYNVTCENAIEASIKSKAVDPKPEPK